MIEIALGGAERGHPFFRGCILTKKYALNLSDLSQKEISESFDKSWGNCGCFF